MQISFSLRRFILSFVACLVQTYFFTLFRKGTIFEGGGGNFLYPNVCFFTINLYMRRGGGNFLNTNVCFYFLHNVPETFLNLGRIQRDIIINVHKCSCKVPVVLVKSKRNLNFVHRYQIKYSNVKFRENPPSASRAVSCGRRD